MAAGLDSPTPTGGVAAALRHDATRRAGTAAVPLVALVTLTLALAATAAADVPLRDPKGVTLTRLSIAVAMLLGFVLLDLTLRARRRTPGRTLPTREALAATRRERWTPARAATAGAALLGFFLTYLAYRNLKSVVPLLHSGLEDAPLGDLDRAVAFGNEPAQLLHGLLGTSAAAHVLSLAYMAFFLFIPVTLTAALALLTDLRAGLTYAAALAANWLLAAGSYFVLPSLGPIYADPALFADLPVTAVSDLQALLIGERTAFLANPAIPGSAQSIGAFASLHTSIVVTAAIAAHLLGLPRIVKAAAWAFVALTLVATIYFGWHYLADDVAGVAIAVVALLAARALTGYDLREARAR
jgi:hypothetical protein